MTSERKAPVNDEPEPDAPTDDGNDQESSTTNKAREFLKLAKDLRSAFGDGEVAGKHPWVRFWIAWFGGFVVHLINLISGTVRYGNIDTIKELLNESLSGVDFGSIVLGSIVLAVAFFALFVVPAVIGYVVHHSTAKTRSYQHILGKSIFINLVLYGLFYIFVS